MIDNNLYSSATVTEIENQLKKASSLLDGFDKLSGVSLTPEAEIYNKSLTSALVTDYDNEVFCPTDW